MRCYRTGKIEYGFTFVEVLIVMLVAAILASIAYPSYVDSVRKARRSEAKADIVRTQILQEKYRVSHTEYAPDTTTLSVSSSSSHYLLSTTPVTGSASTSYEVVATAQANQAQDSERGISCTTMKLSVVAGQESYTPAQCW